MSTTSRQLKVLMDRARMVLCSMGHEYIENGLAVKNLMAKKLGNPELPTDELVKLFLSTSEQSVASPTRLVIDRPYKPDRAMQLATKRAQPHPEMHGIPHTRSKK